MKISNIPYFLLIGIFFILPLIHSHIFEMIWINFPIYVDGNYEFTKVMFFNILSWIIIPVWLLTLWRKRKNIIIPQVAPILILIFIVSSYFSLSPFTSIFWNTSKAHSTVMFLNLIGIFIILINMKREFLKKLILTMIASSLLVLIIWIKEYYFPTFDYSSLSNRALSTLGHPNYLALYILLIIPFVFSKEIIPSYIRKYILWWLLTFTLLVTKSLWWIIIFISYIIYKINPSIPKKWKKIFFWSIFLLFFSSIWYLVYDFSYITKLHSFLSRFFIWTTTLQIIFSDFKTFLLWWWPGTLEFVFDAFKSPYLYLFENFWFTADRPHNIFLNFFYHLGIFGFLALSYILIKFVKTYKNSAYHESILLFTIFTLFNFPWITHYLIIILIWAIIYKENYEAKRKNSILKPVIITLIIWGSIIWTLFWIQYYSEENKLYKNENYKSSNNIYKKIKNSDPETTILTNRNENLEKRCKKLIQYSSSVENYFHCWNILWNTDKYTAKQYYNKWLQKTPNLWNKNSEYYKNPIVRYFIDWKRFFSPKYSNIEEILKRVWE